MGCKSVKKRVNPGGKQVNYERTKQDAGKFIYLWFESKNCQFIKHTVYFQFLACFVSHSRPSKFTSPWKFVLFKKVTSIATKHQRIIFMDDYKRYISSLTCSLNYANFRGQMNSERRLRDTEQAKLKIYCVFDEVIVKPYNN